MRSTFLLRNDSLSAVLMGQKVDRLLALLMSTRAGISHRLDYSPIFQDVEDRLFHLRFLIVDDSRSWSHGPRGNHLQTNKNKSRYKNEKNPDGN